MRFIDFVANTVGVIIGASFTVEMAREGNISGIFVGMMLFQYAFSDLLGYDA